MAPHDAAPAGSALGVDAVYVLTVKSFAGRIAHARAELGRFAIPFEFIFDFDADELDDAAIGAQFSGSGLTRKHISLVLKHMQSWRLACARGQRRIMVFEDDVLLHPNFRARLVDAMRAADALKPGWLIFLGGADTKVPDWFFLHPGPLMPLPNVTAEGYVTDREACQRRLDWCASHTVTLPADHLLTQIDREQGVQQYWPAEALVEQGSVTGMFSSQLDATRLKHSRFYNIARNRWLKWHRRTLRKYWVRALHAVQLK